MSRVVRKLEWARELTERPRGIPKGRPRGPKAIGVRYEKALAKALGEGFVNGVWFEYGDAEGRHYCQVDFLYERAERLFILEAKYTWTAEAYLQLQRLYLPVVAMARKRELDSISCLQICKNITYETKKYTRLWLNLENALNAIHHSKNNFHTVQWLPNTPIGATTQGAVVKAMPSPLL